MFDPLKASETIVDVVPQTLCLSLENLIEQLKEVEQQGGEGYVVLCSVVEMERFFCSTY